MAIVVLIWFIHKLIMIYTHNRQQFASINLYWMAA